MRERENAEVIEIGLTCSLPRTQENFTMPKTSSSLRKKEKKEGREGGRERGRKLQKQTRQNLQHFASQFLQYSSYSTLTLKIKETKMPNV